MKRLTLIFAAFTLGLTLSAQVSAMEMDHSDTHSSAEASVNAQEESQVITGDVHVSVNGLVCDFCARALEKVFGKQEAVHDIDVNLDTKIITIDFKDGQSLDDMTIKQLVQDSGYNVENIHHVEK